jgi:hypothetical protein
VRKRVSGGTGPDERVCDICRPLHGKIARIGEAFNHQMSERGRKMLKGKLVTQPPAHPNCRCAMAPATKPATQKKKPKKKKPVLRPKLDGFDRELLSDVNRLVLTIPNAVKSTIKALRGQNEIKMTSGRIIDDSEAAQYIPPALVGAFSDMVGLYVGGTINRIFVSPDADAGAVMHEIGHAIYDEYLKLDTRKSNIWREIHAAHEQTGDFISPRSAHSHKEHFADAIRLYLTKPEILRYGYPEIYDFLRANVFLGNERESIVTLDDGFKIFRTGRWVTYRRQ